MARSRMGGKKLSQFGGSNPKNPVEKKSQDFRQEETLTTVNIKISTAQQNWLRDTAQKVRYNNTEPVPPADRVYPQHLIQVAIDLLMATEVDWNQVRSIEDLKKQLNL